MICTKFVVLTREKGVVAKGRPIRSISWTIASSEKDSAYHKNVVLRLLQEVQFLLHVLFTISLKSMNVSRDSADMTP